MATPAPSLHVSTVGIDSDEYRALAGWEFDQPEFYARQIPRLLAGPVRELAVVGCRVFVYRADPGADPVGFSTLVVSDAYRGFDPDGRAHAYIPLLAVHPRQQGRGYGRALVEHLIGQAADLLADSPHLSDLLFLDVYVANAPAVGLYKKCGFVVLNETAPKPDPDEGGQPYYVMARPLNPPAASD